jgi:hypothetical protein
MFISHKQNADKNQNTDTGNNSFKTMAKFKSLGTTLAYQNCVHEESKCRLNLWNVATLCSTIFYLGICHLKTLRLKYREI